MMNFRIIKNSVIDILGAAADVGGTYEGEYQTIGFQRQSTAGDEILNQDRMVTVFYRSGGFPKSGGSKKGPTSHEISFMIQLLVSADATLNLSVLNDPEATIEAKQAAWAAFAESSKNADDLMDELWEIVYQVLMDARNQWLGLEKSDVSDRWVDQFEKDDPVPQGELLTLSASTMLTCKTQEQVTGEVGAKPPIVKNQMNTEINKDETQKTEIER